MAMLNEHDWHASKNECMIFRSWCSRGCRGVAVIFTSSKLNMQASLPQTEMYVAHSERQKSYRKNRATGVPKGIQKKVFLNFTVPSHNKVAHHRVFIYQPFRLDTMKSAPERRYFGNNKKLLTVFIRMMIMKTKVAENEWSSSMNSSFCHMQTLIWGFKRFGEKGHHARGKAIWQP